MTFSEFASRSGLVREYDAARAYVDALVAGGIVPAEYVEEYVRSLCGKFD